MTRTRRRALRALGIGFVLLVAVDQVVQHTALADGELFGRRIAPFDPPLYTAGQRAAVERIRAHVERGEPLAGADFDAELGWSPPKNGGSGEFVFDHAGCRAENGPLAREKTAGVTRIVAVGCSFTLGDEVKSGASWCACLDRLPGLEVANLGMGAYGIDQAWLRFQRDGVPLAPEEVWLGWVPSASLRVLTMYLPAMRHWAWSPAFKPRFVLLDDGSLATIENPARTPRDLLALLSDQRRFLDAVAEHDVWIRRAPSAYAPLGSIAWHRSALARLVLTIREHAAREARPWIEDDTSECARLVRAIGIAMRADVVARGARFRLLVLPDRADLADRDSRGRPYWSAIVAAWRAAGVEVIDLADDFQAVGGARDAELWAPEGHYSAAGNRFVAEAITRHLERAR